MARLRFFGIWLEVPAVDEKREKRVDVKIKLTWGLLFVLLFLNPGIGTVESSKLRIRLYLANTIFLAGLLLYLVRLKWIKTYGRLVAWSQDHGFEISRFDHTWRLHLVELQDAMELRIRVKRYAIRKEMQQDSRRQHVWVHLQGQGLPRHTFRILTNRVFNNSGYPIRREYRDFRYLDDYIITSDNLDLTQKFLATELADARTQFGSSNLDFLAVSGKQITIEASFSQQFDDFDITDMIDLVFNAHNSTVEIEDMAFSPILREYRCLACDSTQRVGTDYCKNCNSPLPRCVICFNDLQKETAIHQFSCCSYYVHEEELQTWKLDHDSCPVCREAL